eukprot:Sro61_g034910.2  (516) ;mRNA; f:26623-28170
MSSTQILELEFEANDHWAFVKHSMWLDSDIKRVPKTETGRPDERKFPFFWDNPTGSKTWKAASSLKCANYPRSTYEVTALVRSFVVPTFENGTLMRNESALTSYGIEHEGSGGLHLGWLDFMINCNCPENPPSQSPTSPPLKPIDNCASENGGGIASCHQLQDHFGSSVATVCAEQDPQSGGTDIVFTAKDAWRFISHQVWVGFDLASMPLLDSGRPDHDAFPYKWRNPVGERRWNLTAAVSCRDGEAKSSRKVFILSRSTARTHTSSGSREATVWSSNFSTEASVDRLSLLFFEVDCSIGNDTTENSMPVTSCNDPTLQLEGAFCGSTGIQLAGECLDEPAGIVDLALSEADATTDQSIEIYFGASPRHSFQSTKLWLGRDMSQMPRQRGDGTPDLESFPFFASDKSGYNNTLFRQELNLLCVKGTESLTFYGVAHAVVQDATENNEVSIDIPISSYGYMHDGQNSSDWFGYFDFTVRCHCPRPIRTDALRLSPLEQAIGTPSKDELLVQMPSP